MQERKSKALGGIFFPSFHYFVILRLVCHHWNNIFQPLRMFHEAVDCILHYWIGSFLYMIQLLRFGFGSVDSGTLSD